MRRDITAGNEYHTPADRPHVLIDRLTFRSRWVFTAKFVYTVFHSRHIARKGAYDADQWVSTSNDIFTYVEECGGKIHITGMDHIRNCKEPVIILSNHMSTLETMIFPGIIQPLTNVTFVVKQELVRHWFFRDVMKSRNPIVLSRENPREDFRIVMKRGPELLKNGTSVIIFPQGTRKSVFIPSEFNSLGIKLAALTGAKVIPAAIRTDFWEQGKLSSYLGPLHRELPVNIAFGEPITVTGNGREEHQKTLDFIVSHLKRWNAPTA